tara:strand:- start:886 stop:1359 length:474 start_codon:yes stop_codon:yes gene_type:complete
MEICITRFDDKTILENRSWRYKNDFYGCIYGSPVKITENILPETNIIVVEMNNSKNIIEGFGIIKNKLSRQDKQYKIYSENNYNRYIYKSNYRIDKEEIIDNYIKSKIEEIEKLLFKSKYHCKRGHGIQKIPNYIKINKDFDYLKFIKNLCKSKFFI